MYLLAVGVVLLLLKDLEIAPVEGWSWLLVLSPFGLAVAWWAWADASGYSKRKAVQKMEKRRRDRLHKQHEALGTAPSKRK
jgi:small Trp-rich protein